MLPAVPRLPEALPLIEFGLYFVVPAPRRTGKTTTLSALVRELNATGRYVAVRVSCERARAFRGDIGGAELAILKAISGEASGQKLPAELMPPSPWPETTPGSRLIEGLSAWAAGCPLPVVLFFDEIDALRGASLDSVLGQLRDGRTSDYVTMPSSVVLCGLRDVRDYKAASGGDPDRLGGPSPFNVSVKSLRIPDFTVEQVAELYGQHTAATGQQFSGEAVRAVFAQTQGQPWLVNALAWEIIEEMRIVIPETVTEEHVATARERLIQARATHLGSLADKLYEPRVAAIIGPMIAGRLPGADVLYDDDLSYLRDLGLIARDEPIRPANPIYAEVIGRVLTQQLQRRIQLDPRSYLMSDGRIDMAQLLTEFAAWWREYGDGLDDRGVYHEAAAQIAMAAYLQRVVNGGGHVDREMVAGTGRLDLVIRKPCTTPAGKPATQREVIELKVRHPGGTDPLEHALTQLDGYLETLGLDHGYLVIFDRREPVPVRDRIQHLTTETTPGRRKVTLLRL
jgi:hypothetical protein